MRYHVKALNADGVMQSHSLDATDRHDLQQQLALRQMTLVKASPVQPRATIKRPLSALIFAQDLHALTQAGLDVKESIDALVEREQYFGQATALELLRKHLLDGLSLSAAMEQQQDHFPPLLVGLVRSSETTSDLAMALMRYVQYESRVRNVNQKLISAALYPLIVLIVGLLVGLFLMTYIVPRFSTIYLQSSAQKKVESSLVLEWGTWVNAHPLWTGFVLLFLLTMTGLWIRRQLKNGQLWTMFAAFPGGKSRVQVMGLSRLYMTIGMLVESGVPIFQAMTIATQTLPFQAQAGLQKVQEMVSAGHKLSDALLAQNLSTPIAFRLVRIGEKTGQVGEMLSRAAVFHEEETSRWMERMASIASPLLMLFIAVFVGTIVIMLYIPIFDLANGFDL